jgi:hypothetical protein
MIRIELIVANNNQMSIEPATIQLQFNSKVQQGQQPSF